MIIDYFIALAYVFSLPILGWIFSFFVLGKWFQEKNLFIKIPLSFIKGNFLMSFFLHFIYFFNYGFVLTKESFFVYLVIVLGIWLGLVLPKEIKRITVYEIVTFLLLLSFFFPFFKESLFSFLFAWDPVAIWMLKAKAFFFSNSFWETSLYLEKNNYLYAHKAYPVGIPLIVSFYYKIINFVNDQAVKVYFMLFYFNIFLFFIGVIYEQGKRFFFTKLMFSLGFLLAPLFILFSYNGYMDLPLSFGFVILIYLLKELIVNKQRSLIYVIASISFSLGFVLKIKYEAMPFSVFYLFAVSWVVWYRFRGKKVFREILVRLFVYVLFSLSSYLMWRLFLFESGLKVYFQPTITELSNIIYRAYNLYNWYFVELIDTSRFGVLILITLVFLVIEVVSLFFSKDRIHLILFIIILLQILFYNFVYLFMPLYLEKVFFNSFERLFLHIMPSILFIVIHYFYIIEKAVLKKRM